MDNLEKSNIDNYKDMEKISFGSYSKIYKAHDKNNQTIVVKKIEKSKDPSMLRNMIDLYKDEIYVLKKLKNECDEYFLCYIDNFEDDKYFYIVTEYLEKYIELFEIINQPNYYTTLTYQDNFIVLYYELIRGLNILHKLNIAHRDIKPENIMVNLNNLKIKYIDFGFACAIDTSYQCIVNTSSKKLGTIDYVSPDYLNKRDNEVYTIEELIKNDIWSLGMTIFQTIIRGSYYDMILEKNKDYDLLLQYKYSEVDRQRSIYDIIVSKTPINIDDYIKNSWFYAYMDDPLYIWVNDGIKSMLQIDPNERKLPKLPDLSKYTGYNVKEKLITWLNHMSSNPNNKKLIEL